MNWPIDIRQLPLDIRQLPRWLWYANAVVFFLALLVLFFGLFNLAPLPPDAQEMFAKASPLTAAEKTGDHGSKVQGVIEESPLVQQTRRYAIRWAPLPSLPPAPSGPVRAADLQRPAPPKPIYVAKAKTPAAAPKPQKPPEPTFKAIATLMIGADDGVVWAQIEGQPSPKPFRKGQMIEEYKIEQVDDGKVVVSREKFNFEVMVNVPAPRSIEASSEDIRIKAVNALDGSISVLDLSPPAGSAAAAPAPAAPGVPPAGTSVGPKPPQPPSIPVRTSPTLRNRNSRIRTLPTPPPQ